MKETVFQLQSDNLDELILIKMNKTPNRLNIAFNIVQHYEIKCFDKLIIYVPITISLFHPPFNLTFGVPL